MVKIDIDKIQKFKDRYLKYVSEDYIDGPRGRASLITQRTLEKMTEEKIYEWFEQLISE